MADKDMLDFLAGLKALYSFDYGTASLVGPDRVVIGVIDDTPPGVTVQQAASWIVEACRRASRTCATCRFRDERGWCEVNARTYPSDGFCSEWEAADAER